MHLFKTRRHFARTKRVSFWRERHDGLRRLTGEARDVGHFVIRYIAFAREKVFDRVDYGMFVLDSVSGLSSSGFFCFIFTLSVIT